MMTCTGYAQTDARTRVLDTKPGLEKKITLTLRAASLREVLAKVEAETGVRLRPDREIAEDKCTVWVKDKPARDVLKAVAKCFNLGWAEAEIGSLRYLNLYMDREYQKSMNQKMYEDYTTIVGQFDQEMKVMADAINSKTEIRPDPASMAALTSDQRDRMYLRYRFSTSPQYGSMVIQYLHLSEIQKKDLFAGKDVTVPKDAICKEARDLYPEATNYTFWVVRSLSGYLLQGTVQPAQSAQDWLLITTALFDDTRYDKTIDTANAALLKEADLTKEPQSDKPVVTPSAPAPPKADVTPPWMQAPISLPVPKPGEGSGATPTTMSDGLLPLAEAAGIPLVAQYLSEYTPDNTPAVKPGKIAEQIGALSKVHKFAVEKNGDFLYARALLWHRLRDREVTETTISRWQKAITGLPMPTFEVAIEMGNMSWGQVRGIIANGARWFGTSDLSVIARTEYALKLYASLTSSQQRALGAGQPVPIAGMRPDQQQMFMQAFEFKARPSYAKAKDPSWPQVASVSMDQPRCANAVIHAISNMRSLGTEDLDKYFPADAATSNEDETTVAARVAHFQTALPQAAKVLMDRVLKEHPDIARKSIGTYGLFHLTFSFNIGDDQNSSGLLYCAPVQ